ncbi:MAG TPA: MmcQ/YjbR family DNA-binding protein [Parvularculaceae bacterium]|nr:MmcQ/YjbR family DNA-binding protein [Parvularculaceae bacterium]
MKAKKNKRAITFDEIKAIAESLALPGVTQASSWGQPCLKVNGKIWFFWSPSEEAPVFKVSFDERDMLVEADPDTFFFTPHYKAHKLILARPDRIDREWIRANLIRTWRELAPKRAVREFDEKNGMKA